VRSVGPLIDRNCSGAVHSTFERTANLQTNSGLLYTVTRPDVPELPSGIRTELPAHFSFEENIAVGERFGCRAEILRIGKSGLQLDLRDAPTSNAQITQTTPVSLTTIWLAWRYLLENAPLAELISGIAPIFTEDSLISLLSADDAQDILTSYFGRGPGLTPAGDDFIVGFIASNHARANNLAPQLDANATNDISFAALSEASQGYFSAAILNLIESLQSGQSKILKKPWPKIWQSERVPDWPGLLVF